ncbi:glutamate synthase [Moniliophthora roreri]|nr:glutamate synthase [Moniliophthora roreri]
MAGITLFFLVSLPEKHLPRHSVAYILKTAFGQVIKWREDMSVFGVRMTGWKMGNLVAHRYSYAIVDLVGFVWMDEYGVKSCTNP